MRRFILTGAPGAGKTAVLRALGGRGLAVVEEAATDVIALAQARGEGEPWLAADFVDRIATLQARRLQGATAAVQVHDRSFACTLALARFLERPVTPRLAEGLARMAGLFERRVFFIRNLGVCEPTAARRISFEESLRFEAVHEAVYRELGYELVDVPAAPVEERVGWVLDLITSL